MLLERVVYSILCIILVCYMAKRCLKTKSNWSIGILRFPNNRPYCRDFDSYKWGLSGCENACIHISNKYYNPKYHICS